MKILLELSKEVLPLLGISLLFLAVAGVLLLAILGRSFFPEGNLLDILAVCLTGNL